MLNSEQIGISWKKSSLGELSEVSAGNPAPPQSNLAINETPFIRVSDLANVDSIYIYNSRDSITEEKAKEYKLRKFPKGSTIFPKSGMSLKLNRRAILGSDSYVVSHLAVIIPKNGILSEWIYYYLKTVDMGSYCSKSDFPSLPLSVIKKIPIILPPDEIRSKIVQVFNKENELQQKQEILIDLVNSLMDAVFVKMFGKPENILHTLNSSNLSSIAELRGGITMSSSRRNGKNKVPYLTVRNLYRDNFDFSDVRSISVSESDLQKWHLEYGDLCVLEGCGNRKDLGRTAIYQDNPKLCVHQNHIFRIRLNKKILNPFYVGTYLNSSYVRSLFYQLAKTTSGLYTINLTDLSSICIPIPDIEKQNRFEKIYFKIKELQSLLLDEVNLKNLLKMSTSKILKDKMI